MSIARNPQVPVYGTFYTSLTILCAAPHGLSLGQVVAVTGNAVAEFNNPSYVVSEVVSATVYKVSVYTETSTVGLGGLSTSQGVVLSRSSNQVTGTTAATHGLKVGYQIIISGVTNTALGGGITACVRLSNVATVTTAAAHNLIAGSIVTIAGSSGGTFDQNNATILSVPSSTTFTYSNGGADLTVGAGGTVSDIWNGTFYVNSIPSSTTFTYSNIGPNDTAASTGSPLMTPNGQISGGQHQCVVIFQTRSGYLTAPSPSVTFTANGGQYLLVSNIPLGPPNVVARYLAFTGSGGANFFGLLSTPVVNNQLVGTSTVIPDNTTTSALLDFSDATLFSGNAIDIPGNNLFALQVLPPCLGTFSYAGRLLAWGFRNNVRNFLNMGFDGGYYFGSTDVLGWTVASAGGALDAVDVDFGFAWKVSGGGANPQGMITQPAYQDDNNVPILAPSVKYTARVWAKASGANLAGTIFAELYSITQGSIAIASMAASSVTTTGEFYEMSMNVALPTPVPTDLLLRFYTSNLALGTYISFDEFEIIPQSNPLSNTQFMVSYVNNFESFDGVTGILGSSDDPNPLRDAFEIRDNLYFGTSERLHETVDLANSEPSGWTVREVSKNVGFASAFSSTGQQEQNGEDFALWCTESGVRIFEGGQPYKISQEIQPIWNRINWEQKQTMWLVNDVITRRCYIGVPLDEATTPSAILVLDYRELDTGSQISSASPVHISFTGRMIASDLARKWTTWNLPMNCGSILTRDNHTSQFVVGDGRNFGEAYTFDQALLTDDNYGQVYPYYTTYFFVNHDQEQQLQLGSSRKLFAYLSAFVTGVGNFSATPYGDVLTNAWPATPLYPLSSGQSNDFYWGLNVTAERCAFRFASVPLAGQTDNSFNLQKVVCWMKQEPIAGFGAGV